MINIAKLLKDAPTGMKLYSPLLGEVEFAEVMDTSYMPIRVMKRGYGLRFDKYGRYMGNEYPDAECLLFPSKDCRTWEYFKLPTKPKFKVEDWIANDYCVGKVIALTDDAYLLDSGQGIPFSCEHNAHLWTIQDAKDGDVLVDTLSGTRAVTILFRGINADDSINAYCGWNEYTFRVTTNGAGYGTLSSTRYVPATKEQRDLLFKKMKEAGYQWDADKKELKKIKFHYDIANFHAGMPVLVRDYIYEEWRYVSFEVAKFLKEKGFDWPCICYYEDNGIIHEALDYVRQNDGDDDDNDECLCPTQQMACDWLTEEKNIYITAIPDIGNSLRFYPAIYVIKGEIPEEYWFEHINSVVEELNKSYGKPQQAVEAALQYVLTNLI